MATFLFNQSTSVKNVSHPFPPIRSTMVIFGGSPRCSRPCARACPRVDRLRFLHLKQILILRQPMAARSSSVTERAARAAVVRSTTATGSITTAKERPPEMASAMVRWLAQCAYVVHPQEQQQQDRLMLDRALLKYYVHPHAQQFGAVLREFD